MALDALYVEILRLLLSYYEENPLTYVGCSTLRSHFNTPAYALRPYAETLELNGYVEKLEGMSPTYMVRITKKGQDAARCGTVEITRDCTIQTPLKLRILAYLKAARDSGADTYYVPHRCICRDLELTEHEAGTAVEELAYMGLVRLVGGMSHSFTIQITDKGIAHLNRNNDVWPVTGSQGSR